MNRMTARVLTVVISCSATVLAQEEQIPGYNPPALALPKIQYFTDAISQHDGEVVKLFSGSIWLLKSPLVVLPFEDVVVVMRGEKNGTIYTDGQTADMELVSGKFVAEEGYLGRVERALGHGAILQLNDGSLWEVTQYDQYHTGYWLPPYPVVVTANQLFMVNLKEGKRIWVTHLQE